MRPTLPTIFLAAALSFPAAALSAQDNPFQAVLGEWEMTMETPRGTFTQQFVFTLDGDTLQGMASSQRGESALQDVKFEDGKLSFGVVRSRDGQTMTQSFTATIEGDTMKGTVSGGRGEREFTATRKAT